MTSAVLLLSRPALPVVAIFAHTVENDDMLPVAEAIATELTSELTATLAEDAGVVGPTGTAAMSGPNDMETARSMGICLIVSGAITPVDDDRVAVFTQMVRTRDRVHVWARIDTLASPVVPESVTPSLVAGVQESLTDCTG